MREGGEEKERLRQRKRDNERDRGNKRGREVTTKEL